MYILKDEDIEFVVNDYLRAYSEDARKEVVEVIKQDRERLGFTGNGDVLRSRLEPILGPAVNYAVLNQKLYFKREIEELKDTGIRFYEWGFGNTNYCHNGHSQMDKKIFCVDDDDHYYVRKPKKLLVRRERPSRMPKGSPYDANEICNCVMMAFLVEANDYTITDVEPEPTTKKTSNSRQTSSSRQTKTVQPVVSERPAFKSFYLDEPSTPPTSKPNSAIARIIAFIIAIVIAIAIIY